MKLKNIRALGYVKNALQASLLAGIVVWAAGAARAQGNPAPATTPATTPATSDDAGQNTVAGQSADAAQTAYTGQSSSQTPAPAYGQENAPPPISENPPISGLDLPGLEPHAAPLSYIQPGATVSESLDSNVANSLGIGSVHSVSRALGSVVLQRLWSHYDLAADYIGGIGYYNVHSLGVTSLQQADIDQKITWKRGQLSLRDSFSYLPEGNFGGAYGSLGSQGISSLGNSNFNVFINGGAFASLGTVPRLLNVSVADVSQYLTPKSAITSEAGYAVTHFYGNDPSTGGAFLNSSQISAETGYSRLLTPQTQVALEYGYQGFDFSTFGTAFHSHIIEAMVGHTISGRMDFLIAAGPQITDITNTQTACTITLINQPLSQCLPDGGTLITQTSKDRRLGVAGQARLRYRFPKTSLDLTYQRFLTSGSGLFLGSQSDVARFDASRPITRVWGAVVDLGFARNTRQQNLTPAQLSACVEPGQPNPGNLPVCPGIDAARFDYGFAGFAVHRAVGHDFHLFGSYQFNELTFDHSFCGGLAVCSRIANRHVVTFGLDWTPRPIRLD